MIGPWVDVRELSITAKRIHLFYDPLENYSNTEFPLYFTMGYINLPFTKH